MSHRYRVRSVDLHICHRTLTIQIRVGYCSVYPKLVIRMLQSYTHIGGVLTLREVAGGVAKRTLPTTHLYFALVVGGCGRRLAFSTHSTARWLMRSTPRPTSDYVGSCSMPVVVIGNA